jgi:hypothetical protein
MITDAQTRFSSGQAVTTGTQVSTNSYDLGIARDVGRGGNLRVYANATATFTGGTSLQASVVESVNSDLSSATVIVSGPVFAEASLVAGTRLLDVALPLTSKRYLGVQYTSVGTHTAGTVDSGIVIDTDSGTTFAANTGF